jgi:acetyl esterase/lipase
VRLVDALARQRHRLRRRRVNYQKAPEHKFPVPFNDAWAGLTWVVEHAEELFVDPARIAVGGDSAGGNLAAVAIKAREDGGPALALQLLIYPVVEHSVDTPSAIQNAEGYLLQRASMRWYWAHYLDGATDTPDWRASPLRAASHADLHADIAREVRAALHGS